MHISLLVISVLFAVPYALLIRFYRRNWKAIPEVTDLDHNQLPVFISVVIAARNEERNIPHLLKALEQQRYSPGLFEIIIVDDSSQDDTEGAVRRAGLKNLRVIKASSNNSSKKKALEAGILQAKGELIVTTDADCIPKAEWLTTIAFYYRQADAAFLAGPVRFSFRAKWIEVFQAIDFLILQGITGAAVYSQFHMMCNGANLAFKKTAFEDVGGYAGIDKIATGDDMLLMHKIWKKGKGRVHFIKSKDAIVSTLPMPDIKSLLMQRKRWASKTFIYEGSSITLVLVFVFCYNLCLLGLTVMAVLNPSLWLLVLPNIAFKALAEISFFKSIARFYEEKGLAGYFILFQPLHIFYTVCVGLISQMGRYEWKGRRTY